MKTISELRDSLDAILNETWDRRDGTTVPEPKDVKLANGAVDLEATVLYADLAESTALVDGYKDWFSASIYKMYLLLASELIKNNGGVITAYDGDRVMGVFIGSGKNSAAAKCALQINHMVSKELNPKLKRKYPTSSYQVEHAVGIDTSKLMVARTGIWGTNDLVWVGRSANYAAKLCGLRDSAYSSIITEDVYSALNEQSKYGGNPKKDMWTKFSWEEYGKVAYKSSWMWAP